MSYVTDTVLGVPVSCEVVVLSCSVECLNARCTLQELIRWNKLKHVWCWFGKLVGPFVASMKVLYDEVSQYWDRWPSSDGFITLACY